MPRFAAMWSGGKDGAFAITRARERGLDVALLLNFYDAPSARVRFHATRAEVIAAQAAATGIPLRQVATTWEGFDAAFRAALTRLKADGFAGVVFGDIHLADVRAWYEERVRAAGLEHIEPIWGEEPAALLRRIVASGLRAAITCVELAKLDETWLGRVVDESFVEAIARTGVDPCGENGEYHSFAFAGPLFRHELLWVVGERRVDGGFAQIDVVDLAAEVASRTIGQWPDLAVGTRTARPKAWGALAAHGVAALRERLGRKPTDAERRAVWGALWRGAREEPDPDR